MHKTKTEVISDDESGGEKNKIKNDATEAVTPLLLDGDDVEVA